MGFEIDYGVLTNYEEEPGVTEITIPDGVTEIERFAFEDCTSLTSVTIPSSVTEIGESVFYNCKGLTSINIPDSIRKIESSAFFGCTSLTTLTVDPNNTEYASENSLILNKDKTKIVRCAPGLTSVTIPDSVTKIGDYAFLGCTSLTSIFIPGSVTEIDAPPFAFQCCTSLTAFTVDPNNTEYASENGLLLNKDKTSVIICAPGLTSVTIPDSVTEIEDYAFLGCTNLTSITIPNSVTKIDWGAFYACTNLTSVTISDSVTQIDRNAFEECASLTSVTIPDSVTEIGLYAFCGCTDLTSVTLGKGLVRIAEDAFNDISDKARFLTPNGLPDVDNDTIKKFIIPNWTKFDPAFIAWLFINKHSKPFLNQYSKFDGKPLETVGKAIPDVLGNDPSAKQCTAAADFISMFYTKIDGAVLGSILSVIKSSKNGQAAFETIKALSSIMEKLGFAEQDEDDDNRDESVTYGPAAAIVEDDWVIAVPKGYKCCTDKSQIMNRSIVLGIDDKSLNFKVPFEAKYNFSAFDPIKKSGREADPETVFGLANQAKNDSEVFVRNDSDLFVGYKLMDKKDRHYYGYIVTESNVYVFQVFDKIARTYNEATERLEIMLNSIVSRYEYDENNYDIPELSTGKKGDSKRTEKSEKALKSKPAKQPEKASPKPSSPAAVKPAESAPAVTATPSKPVSLENYTPPVFPERMSEEELENLYTIEDFDGVYEGKEFVILDNEGFCPFYKDHIINGGGTKVLYPTEKTDYIAVINRWKVQAFEYAHKMGYRGRFIYSSDLEELFTDEEKDILKRKENGECFYPYEPGEELTGSYCYIYTLYDVTLCKLMDNKYREYGTCLPFIKDYNSLLELGRTRYFHPYYDDVVLWIKRKNTEESFDKYEKLFLGMAFEDKLFAVMQVLGRYEWTGYEDDQDMNNYAYSLTQRWFKKSEKAQLKEKIAQMVDYLRYRCIGLDDHFPIDYTGNLIPYVDLLRYEWSKERLCIVARTDKKQKVLKSDLFSSQQGDVRLFVCYAALTEKEDYYYLDNTFPFQWQMTPEQIWQSAKEKIVWLSKKEMPADLGELIENCISECAKGGEGMKKKIADKIKKQASQLEKNAHGYKADDFPCLADIGAMVKKLEAEKAELEQQLKALESEMSQVSGELRKNTELIYAPVPSAIEKNDTQNRVAQLTEEKSKLGFFKGKQKKALKAQIDELNAKLPQLESAIPSEQQAQQAKYQPVIAELKNKQSALQEQINQKRSEIEDVDSEIEPLNEGYELFK